MQDSSNLKPARQWRRTLETYVFPSIEARKVDEVTRHDVVKILEPIRRAKTRTATLLRERIATVFDYLKRDLIQPCVINRKIMIDSFLHLCLKW
jgi:hypothetical protein